MYLFVSILQKALQQTDTTHTMEWSAILLGALLTGTAITLSRRQARKLKWQLAKDYLKKKFSFKKGKGKGGTFILLLLLLISAAAVLWILWEQAGVFGLILGIVGAVGLLTLILKGN